MTVEPYAPRPKRTGRRGWARLVVRAVRLRRAISVNRRLYLADVLFCGISVVAAYGLRLGPASDFSLTGPVPDLAVAAMLIGAALLPFLGVYAAHPRNVSLSELAQFAKAALLLTLVHPALATVSVPITEVPLSTFAIQFLVLVPLAVGFRLRHRLEDFRGARYRDAPPDPSHNGAVPVLLIGTGTSCDLFLRSIRRDPDPRYRPVGILDDVQETRGLSIHTVPILGSIYEIDEVLAELRQEGMLPARIVFTEPVTYFESSALQALMTWAKEENVGVMRLPSLSAPHSFGAEDHAGLLEIDVEQLLNRPQTKIDAAQIRKLIAGRRVVVTGAGGSIGSELARQIAALGPREIVVIDQCEFNLYSIEMALEQHFPEVRRTAYISCIRDAGRIREIFCRHKPELVFNAAALKHVPIVEMNPCEGILTNAIGTRNVADAARDVGAIAMVQISSDKAVNTMNVMGATKRLAEFYCQALDRIQGGQKGGTRFMVVRFGNVLGSSGSLVPLFQKQIAEGGPLTVTDPRMERFFMTIREAVELTLLASAGAIYRKLGQGEIMVLDMGKPVRIMDLAHRMIRLAGLRPGTDIEIKTIGIRKGEKLFEELFDGSETRHPSGIDGVYSATPVGVSLPLLRQSMASLEAAARQGADGFVRSTLIELIPGYRPAEDQGMETPERVLRRAADAASLRTA